MKPGRLPQHLGRGNVDRGITADAIAAVQQAIAETETLTGRPLVEALHRDEYNQPILINLVTDSGPAFKSAAFARFIASRPELAHVRARKHQRRARTRVRVTEV